MPDFRLTRHLPSAESLTPWFIGGGFALAGILLGYIVVVGSPIVIAVSLGAVLGILLLNALPVAMWILLVGVFMFSGPVYMFVPELVKTGWLFSILGFFLTGAAMLYPVLGRHQPPGPLPFFVYLGISYVCLAIGLSVFSDGPLVEIVGGIKKYFQFWGVMFILATYPFARDTFSRWLVFFGIVAVLQLPATVLQRIFLVPYLSVVNADLAGFVPIDSVVGTFEGTLRGGGSSSVMSLFLVCVMAWLLSARRDHLITDRKFWTMMVIALLPLGMGETKLIVVLLPLAFAMVYLDLVTHRPALFLGGGLIAGLITLGFAYIYFVVQVPDARDMTVAERLQETIDYNFGNVGYFAGRGLNRFTAIVFWFKEHGWNDPVATIFGHGLGSSYGGDGTAPFTGHINDRYPEKLIGQTSSSSILWDLGLLGFTLFMGMVLSAWREAWRLANVVQAGADRAACRTLLAAVSCIPLMAFYSDGITVIPSQQVFTMLSLGAVAWYSRGYRASGMNQSISG